MGVSGVESSLVWIVYMILSRVDSSLVWVVYQWLHPG